MATLKKTLFLFLCIMSLPSPAAVNQGNGNYFRTVGDYSSYAEPALAVSRTYNSLDATFSPLGTGWSMSYLTERLIVTQLPSSNTEMMTIGWVQNYPVRSYNLPGHAIIYLADGKMKAMNTAPGSWALRSDPYGQVTCLSPTQLSPTVILLDSYYGNIGQTYLQQVKTACGGYAVRTGDGALRTFESMGNLAGQFRLASLKVAGGWTTNLSYDTSGRLTQVTSSGGRTLSFSYDAGGKLNRIIGPGGYVLTYAYDAQGKLASVDGPAGWGERYQYQDGVLSEIDDVTGAAIAKIRYDTQRRAIHSEASNGSLAVDLAYLPDGSTSITDAAGRVRVYQFKTYRGNPLLASLSAPCSMGCTSMSQNYDDSGRLTDSTDFNGNPTYYSYDTTGNQVTTMFPSGLVTVDNYDPNTGNLLGHAESSSTTSYAYDSAGNLASTTKSGADGRIQTWTYSYNAVGQVTSADGPLPGTADKVSYQYDGQGQLTAITNGLGQQTSFTAFDAHGRPLSKTDPDGVVTQYAYDARGRLLSATVAGLTSAYAYSQTGLLTSLTLPGGGVYSFTYDGANALKTVQYPNGNKLTLVRDLLGKITAREIRDPSGNLAMSSQFTYNLDGMLSGATNGKGGSRAYTYDGAGNLLNLTDEFGQFSCYGYDAMNRLLSIADQLGGTVNIARDVEGRLAAVTDPIGVTTGYTYNGLGYKTGSTSPDAGAQSYLRDNAGNVTQRTDGAGRTLAYTYDGLNQLTLVAASGEAFDFTYYPGDSAAGKLKRVAGTYTSSDFVYDAARRLTQRIETINGRTFAVAKQYNPDTKTTRITYPSGKVVDYVYDASGGLTTVNVSGQTAISQIQFAAFGPVKQWIAGGKTYGRAFNLDGEVVGITNSDGVVTYVRNLAGQIESQSNGQGYAYDAVGRLVGYAGPAGDQSYEYDANGNRSSQLLGADTLYYDYQSGNNRLADIQTLANAYTYNAAGNVLTNGTLTFTYNAWGRLATVKQGSTTRATYRYNAFGQRVSKVAGSTTSYYVYDDSGLLLGEYNGSGVAIQEFVWLDGLPSMILTPAANYYVHPDHLGTPRLVHNAAGTVIWRWNSDPFGAIAADEDPDGNGVKFTFNLRFPGQVFDKESNLHYNYFRDYDPSIGRYVQSDPIGLAGGMNVYGYVGGNPLNWTDPLGLDATVTATPLASGGFNFSATGTGLAGGITGTFNTGTTNFNQIQTGTYSVTPRPSLPDTFINELFNRNKNAGRPTISNTNDWNTIINPDGSITHGAQIHPGKDGTNGGTSLGCMVTDQPTYNKLNNLFQDNYNNGGVKFIVLPAP